MSAGSGEVCVVQLPGSCVDLNADLEHGKKMEADIVKIGVSGKWFELPRSLLTKYPKTLLGEIFIRDKELQQAIFYLDEVLFLEVIRFYRYGELHKPASISQSVFLKELQAWRIDTNFISDCCQESLDNEQEEIEKALKNFGTGYTFWNEDTLNRQSQKTKIWFFLVHPPGNQNKHVRRCSWLFVLVYLLHMLTQYTLLQSMAIPHSIAVKNETIDWNQHICEVARTQVEAVIEHYGAVRIFLMWYWLIVFFSMEILVRLICCPNKKRFFRSPHCVDFLIIMLEIPIVVVLTVAPRDVIYGDDYMKCNVFAFCAWLCSTIAMFRSFRVIVLSACIAEMKMVFVTIIRSWKMILLLVFSFVMCSFMFAPILYLTNLGAPNQIVGTVSHAQWLVIVTMTTVGYGDFYVETFLGRYCTIIVMMAGMALGALPVAIIGNNFSKTYEVHQKIIKMEENNNPQGTYLNSVKNLK